MDKYWPNSFYSAGTHYSSTSTISQAVSLLYSMFTIIIIIIIFIYGHTVLDKLKVVDRLGWETRNQGITVINLGKDKSVYQFISIRFEEGWLAMFLRQKAEVLQMCLMQVWNENRSDGIVVTCVSA